MEWYFLNGVRAEETESTPRQMNGLVNLVNNDNIVDGSAGLSESLIEDTLYQLWTHGSVKEYYAFVNKEVKRQINYLYRNSENVRINVYPSILCIFQSDHPVRYHFRKNMINCLFLCSSNLPPALPASYTAFPFPSF